MLALLLSSLLSPPQTPVTLSGPSVQVRAVRAGSEYLLEFKARDGRNSRMVLVSPTHPLASPSVQTAANAVSVGGGLFAQAPSFRFSSAKRVGDSIVLNANYSDSNVEQTISLDKGNSEIVRIKSVWSSKSAKPMLHHFLASFAFVPDGKAVRPDETFTPGLRPGPSDVIGDHFFRAPVIIARKGSLSASIFPDVDVLARNRPMPTILDLDAQNGVTQAALMSYGFCDHRMHGHVKYRTDPTMMQRVPNTMRFEFDLRISAKDNAVGLAQKAANKLMWARIGKRHFDRGLPQVLPFQEYPRIAYTAALEEAYDENKIGWFEHEIDGQVCGGIPSGWGFLTGWVSWQCWFNQLRSAWGMYYWGSILPGNDWKERATKMLNLALAAPMDRGACPTTYLSREKKWRGSLIMPDPSCYYDLTNMAWKGIWLLRWLNDFKDCPRKEEIISQCVAMAECMMRNQRTDGAIPTWLTKDHKVVPVLDSSAQTSLPAWFLFEIAKLPQKSVDVDFTARSKQAAMRACKFLQSHVVPGAYYYDFETFFSCSPKECTQRNGKVDHESMRDLHTLQPPQNTLCMQWTAEALFRAFEISKDDAFLRSAEAALDQMALYQNVWPMSFRQTANTFGGFGVQNSDGEFLDARQAQFGSTLCYFGAKLQRQDLFERGVAATRASMTLANHPLHIQNDLYPFPNYPYGLMPENCGHGGNDEQNGRTGFDWGEGSACAAMAELHRFYGDVYHDTFAKWAVGINGVISNSDATKIESLLWRNRSPFTGPIRSEIVTSDGKRSEPKLVAPTISIRNIEAQLRDGQLELFATPAWQAVHNVHPNIRAEFVSDSGKRYPARQVADGLIADFDVSKYFGQFKMVGTAYGSEIQSDWFTVCVNPNFNFTDFNMRGWWITGNVPKIPTYSTRSAFGLSGKPFIGTCEDGFGGFNDAFICNILSPKFVCTQGTITLRVGGGSGKNVYVALIRHSTGEQLFVEHGTNSEVLTTRTWNVVPYVGEQLQIQIYDRETGPWGHVNVAEIRSGN